MPHEKIVNYYLLCSVGAGKSAHPMNSLGKKELDLLMTRKEHEAFLRTLNGKLVANESVIGGDESQYAITDFIIPRH